MHAPSRSNFFHFYAVFGKNLAKLYFFALNLGVSIPPWKVQSPPLLWVMRRIDKELVSMGYLSLSFQNALSSEMFLCHHNAKMTSQRNVSCAVQVSNLLRPTFTM